MIGAIEGVVDGVGPDRVIVKTAGGIGYAVHMGAGALARAGEPGTPIALRIETVVREDSIRLYGFSTETERAWFTRLMGVSGVSAKLAGAILDVLDPDALDLAAAGGDAEAIARAKGVGPKLAQRIVADLAGKGPPPVVRLAGEETAAPSALNPPKRAETSGGSPTRETSPSDRVNAAVRGEASAALVALGFAHDEAARAVAKATKEAGDLDGLIRVALKELAR